MNAIGPQHSTRLIVLSAQDARGFAAIRDLAEHVGATYHSSRGTYKGDPEDSAIIIVDAKDEAWADTVEVGFLALAGQLGQESILVVEEHTREARLRFTKGKKADVAIGKWKSVREHEIAGKDYTYDITEGRYFTAG